MSVYPEDIPRLSNLLVNKNSRDYLVMYYLLQDLSSAITAYANGSVLDVGCGNKPYLPLFENKIDKYIGCDVAQSDKHKVDIICSADDLKFSNDSFDTVFSTQVIEHVDNPLKMIAETARVLRKGGYLILSAPFSWELHEEPFDFYRFTKYGLRAVLESNQYEIIEIKANGGKWAAIFQLNLNIIYSGFNKKGILRKAVKFIFIHLRFTTLLNKIAVWIDKKHYDELLTLNYVVVAKKR